MAIIPTITNGFSAELISALLRDSTSRSALVDTILYEAYVYAYDGIGIDFENMYHEDRDAFTYFIAELGNALHAQGKRLTIAAQAKSYDAFDVDGPGAFDYGALGSLADELRLMTYGWCWSSGCIGSPPPGPISPIHWLTTVTVYAKRKVPADKIVLGVNLYGYDWSPVASGRHSLECVEARKSGVVHFRARSSLQIMYMQGIYTQVIGKV